MESDDEVIVLGSDDDDMEISPGHGGDGDLDKTPTMNETTEEEDGEDDDDYGGFEIDFDEISLPAGMSEDLKRDVKEAMHAFPNTENLYSVQSVALEETHFEDERFFRCVALTLGVIELPEKLRQMWELGDAITVSVLLDRVHKSDYRRSSELPLVHARINNEPPSKFTVGEALAQMIRLELENSYLLRPGQAKPEENYFEFLYGILESRMPYLSEYCLICSKKLAICAILPSICDGELCAFQYTELGLFNGFITPRVSADVLALLLLAFNAANVSMRRKLILTPEPVNCNMSELIRETTMLLGGAQDVAYTGFGDMRRTFARLCQFFPCPAQLLGPSATYCVWRREWPALANFAEWLVITSRAYIERVPSNLLVSFLKTKNQFVFVADSPQKQADFEKLKAANGGKTRFLFHGSPAENWHSIIRSGLKNMSGTQRQMHGAAYGSGIYLASELSLALNYATRPTALYSTDPVDERQATANQGGMDGGRKACKENDCCLYAETPNDIAIVALVEVIDCPDAFQASAEEGYLPPAMQQSFPMSFGGRAMSNARGIHVVKDDRYASIRMLLLYDTTKNEHLEGLTMRWRKKKVLSKEPKRRKKDEKEAKSKEEKKEKEKDKREGKDAVEKGLKKLETHERKMEKAMQEMERSVRADGANDEPGPSSSNSHGILAAESRKIRRDILDRLEKKKGYTSEPAKRQAALDKEKGLVLRLKSKGHDIRKKATSPKEEKEGDKNYDDSPSSSDNESNDLPTPKNIDQGHKLAVGDSGKEKQSMEKIDVAKKERDDILASISAGTADPSALSALFRLDRFIARQERFQSFINAHSSRQSAPSTHPLPAFSIRTSQGVSVPPPPPSLPPPQSGPAQGGGFASSLALPLHFIKTIPGFSSLSSPVNPGDIQKALASFNGNFAPAIPQQFPALPPNPLQYQPPPAFAIPSPLMMPPPFLGSSRSAPFAFMSSYGGARFQMLRSRMMPDFEVNLEGITEKQREQIERVVRFFKTGEMPEKKEDEEDEEQETEESTASDDDEDEMHTLYRKELQRKVDDLKKNMEKHKKGPKKDDDDDPSNQPGPSNRT